MSYAVAAAPPAFDDLAALSTEFTSASALAGWSELATEGFVAKWRAPQVQNGRLLLRPLASGWFDDNQAGHLYREITGDFIVSAGLDAKGANAALPQSEFSLAGLLVRAPREFS